MALNLSMGSKVMKNKNTKSRERLNALCYVKIFAASIS
jgi:hypothetical protein